jgi:apolipoprotein N-acyltransferase
MNTLLPILAVVSGEALIHTLIYVMIIGACLCLVYWLGNFLIGKFGAPPMVATAWMVLFVVLAVLFLINFLLMLIDRPLVRF